MIMQQCFSIIEKSEERTLEFSLNDATIVSVFLLHIIMKTQKIANLFGDEGNESSSLQQQNVMLSMIKIKQTMVKEMRMVLPLNLKHKSLNQIVLVIQTNIFLQQET